MVEGLRIAFARSGGFAGIVLEATVNTAALPPAEARELEALVRQADFFALPERPDGAPGGADRFQYDLTIARGEQRHSVSLGESAVPATLRPLLDRLLAIARGRGKG